MLTYLKHMALAAAAALCAAPAAQAADQPQEWELINPTGEIEKVAVEPAKRITALEGKTIALRWNGKNNGDLVLDRLAELLAKKYPTAKVVKTYRDMADQNPVSYTHLEAPRSRAGRRVLRRRKERVPGGMGRSVFPRVPGSLLSGQPSGKIDSRWRNAL